MQQVGDLLALLCRGLVSIEESQGRGQFVFANVSGEEVVSPTGSDLE